METLFYHTGEKNVKNSIFLRIFGRESKKKLINLALEVPDVFQSLKD